MGVRLRGERTLELARTRESGALCAEGSQAANGSALLETIRRDYKIKHLPVIMCCEMRHVPYARYMTKETILQGYVLKPATLEALSAVLTPLVSPTLPSFNV